jgi:hypothetical protein
VSETGKREQPADAVLAAGVDQRVDPFDAHQAARGVVDEHPVVRLGAEAGELGEPVGDRVGARLAAAAHERETRVVGQRELS